MPEMTAQASQKLKKLDCNRAVCSQGVIYISGGQGGPPPDPGVLGNTGLICSIMVHLPCKSNHDFLFTKFFLILSEYFRWSEIEKIMLTCTVVYCNWVL